MKTTLKVAELASLLYAFLCFGSYCINAIYYSVFGVNISAYMTLSEILLLFLAQPTLYIPILIPVLGLIVFSNNTNEELSINKLYSRIAIRDDLVILFSSIVLYFIMGLWYGIRPETIVLRIILVAIIVDLFVPGYFNAYSLFLRSSSDNLKPKNLLLATFPKFHALFSKKTRQAKRENEKKDDDSPNEQLETRTGIYERYTSNHTFTRSEINRIKWIQKNSNLYFFLLVFSFSLVILCSANYTLALQLKKGAIFAEKDISYEYDGSLQKTNDTLILVGECSKYVFLFDKNSENTLIIDRDKISNMSIHARYPTLKQRVGRLSEQNPEFFVHHPSNSAPSDSIEKQ